MCSSFLSGKLRRSAGWEILFFDGKILMIFRLFTFERNSTVASTLLPLLCCQWPTKCVSQLLPYLWSIIFRFSLHTDTDTHRQHCKCVLFIVPVDDSLVDCFIFVACAHVLTVHAHNAHLHIELSHAHTCTAACLVMWQLHSNCNICCCCCTASAAPAVAGSCTTMEAGQQQQE